MTGKASMPLSPDPETVTLLRETLDDAVLPSARAASHDAEDRACRSHLPPP